jgi:soluble lytic murein transglycosylase
VKILVLLLSLCLLFPVADAEAKRRVRGAKKARKARPPVHAVSPVSYDEPVREFPSDDEAPIWDFWKDVLKARKRLDQGDAREALGLLMKDLPPPPLDIVNKNQKFYRGLYRKALETGLEAAGRLMEPHHDWRRNLWAYFPEHGYEAPVEARAEDRLARLHLLHQQSLFDEIPGTIAPGEIAAAGAPEKDRCRAYFELGWGLQKTGNKEGAVESYGRAAEPGCDDKLRARALFWKGSLEADLDRDGAAEETFKLLTRPSNRYTDDAWERLAGIYRERNDTEAADRALAALLDLPEGDRKEQYLWDEAFSAFQRGDYEAAVERLDRILATRPLGTEAQPQALYWKGRIAEIRSGKKRGGTSAGLYRQVLKSYPFSFYALLAEVRLGGGASMPAVAKLKSLSVSEGPLAEGFRLVDRLNDRGDHEAAADVLDYLGYMAAGDVRKNPEAVAERWIACGDYHRALEIAAEALDRSAFDIDLKTDHPLTRALYPQAYPEEVKRAAATENLPPALLLGIMREESLFQRAVRSRAGAVGVMQLMPATARIKARALGVAHSGGQLTDSVHNIRLGSSFLRDLMDRFGENTPLAVMGYNAGPGNVNKWLAGQGFLPLDEFIEAIPFTETRGYVKRVLRSARIYGHLTGRSKRAALLPTLDPPR